MKAVVVATVLALLLGACSRDAKMMDRGEAATDAPAFADQAAEAAGAAPPSDAQRQSGTGADGGAPMLAYIYGVSLEVPLRSVRSMMSAHEEACRKAGPRVCQVVSSSLNVDGEDRMYGAITLRAEPRWLETLRNGLEGQVKDAGGRLREQSVTSEDLTRQIVDVTARLNAQKTLRDRLQQILRTRPGKLQELLETERELARVQGEIDSAESQLAVMRQRVEMSLLNLNYASRPTAVTGSIFEPVGDAFTEFFAIVMLGFAFIIRAVAVAIPVGLVAAPLWWLFQRWRRARKAKAATG